MAKVSSTIRTSQVKRDGKCNIKIRIFHNGSTRYISTKFNVPLNQFSLSDGRVRKSHPLSGYLNKELKLLEGQYEEKILGIKNIESLSIAQVLSMLREKRQKAELFELMDDYINWLKSQNRIKTAKTFETTKHALEEYTGRTQILMIEVDENFLSGYVDFELMRGNSINTAGLNLRNLRSIFNTAIKRKVISADLYPFRSFKIPKQDTRKRSISAGEIGKIFKAKLTDPYQIQARDTFMLLFFLIGINMKDLYYLKPEDIVDNRIIYKRAKTGKEYSILIQPEAMKIINKYRDPEGEWLLVFHNKYRDHEVFTKQINNFLNEFVPGLKVKMKVTTYVTRHSWATIAYNNGISKDVVQKALGHGTETVTDVYIDFDLKPVDEANRKVIDLIV